MTRKMLFTLTLVLLFSLILAGCSSEGQDSSTVSTVAPAVTEAPAATQAPTGTEAPSATEAPAVTQSSDMRPETPTPGPTAGPKTPLSTEDQTTLQLLQANEWILRSYLDASGAMQDVPAGERGTLNFDPDQVNGTSFCNSFFANYQLEGDRLTISQPGSTLMACQPPKMDLEQIYLQRLVQAATFQLEGSRLVINDSANQEILVFEGGSQTSAPANVLVPAGLQRDSLTNALYRTGFTNDGTAQLKDGAYEEPGPAGSNSKNTVNLVEPIAYGNLADGKPVAAVVTGSNTGGSGTFYELHLVGLLDNGQPVDLAYTFLGDRVKVNAIKFEDGKMVVDMIAQGPSDPMCCPTQQQFLNIEYANGELVVEKQPDTTSSTAPANPPGTANPPATLASTSAAPVSQAAASLTGVVWRWTEFQDASNQRLLVNQPERYKVEFLPDNTLRVEADCNSGTGRYTEDGSQLKIENISMTRMLCPPASLSDNFVQDLMAVVSYKIQNNALYLILNNNAGIMKLIPAP